MKTAISLPDEVFDSAEHLSKRLGMSRSQFYSRALQAFLRANRRCGVREALDALYGEESSRVDLVLEKMQALSLFKEEW